MSRLGGGIFIEWGLTNAHDIGELDRRRNCAIFRFQSSGMQKTPTENKDRSLFWHSTVIG
jgi:hypothetical protein